MTCIDPKRSTAYDLLEWDSRFFGVSVARIVKSDVTNDCLFGVLGELKRQRVKLVYWASSRELESSESTRFSGTLVDRKITFVADLSSIEPDEVKLPDSVESVSGAVPIVDLERLAIQSGEYSRFAVDSRFSREQFVALYKIWINKSVRKENAQEILVVRDGERVGGMVTLGEKDRRGDIGLLAVEKGLRGKGYGEMLVRAAQRWFLENGYIASQVVTQERNTAACKLYTKCGYSREKLEYFYHFWL